MHMCATRPKWVNVIFTPGLTVISTPLNGTWYVECLFYYAGMIIIKSLFSRKAGNRRLDGLASLVATWVVITTTCGANSDVIAGCRLDVKTGDRRLDGFVVAGGTVGCHGDNLRWHRWHLGSLTLQSTVFFGFQCSIDMTFTPDLPW